MITFRVLIALFAIFGGALSLNYDDIKKSHSFSLLPSTGPHVKLTVDGQQLEVPYYDSQATPRKYSKERHDFDEELIDAIVEFSEQFATDVVVKKKYLATIAPRYLARSTKMITQYFPEYSRLMAISIGLGLPIKHGFIGDSTSLWKMIHERLADEEKREVVKRELPKSPEEFVSKMKAMLETTQILVHENPLGIYVDWRALTIDGRGFDELAAPFILYLQEKGYKKHLAILGYIIDLVAKIKPGSSAYEN